jgi:hypothetical protein
MKFTTLALAFVFALSGTFTSAQAETRYRSGAKAHHDTVGMARTHKGSKNYGDPNGTAGGPTSLSGTGSSQFGGSSPGTTGKN